jgi:broad specificity phosphatase PhoE
VARLIIVRHAESALNLQNRIQGHLDSSLTKKGLRQARRLAARLKHFHIDKIYSSDLGRAYSTTVEITKHIRKPIVKDQLLREINLGCWEGMTPVEVDEKFDGGYQRWLKKPSSCRIPEGEQIEKFRRRITGRIREIAVENKGKDVLIVTHGGAITALLADWLGADFDKILLHLQIDNTSLTIVDHTKERYIIRAINDTAHLTSKDRLDELFRKQR